MHVIVYRFALTNWPVSAIARRLLLRASSMRDEGREKAQNGNHIRLSFVKPMLESSTLSPTFNVELPVLAVQILNVFFALSS